MPLAVNGKSSAEPACALAAVARIQQLQQGKILVLDADYLILKECQNKLSSTGQPGVGEAFLLWAWHNHTNPRHCAVVPLAKTDKGHFASFPTAPELADFDPADRKFVAVALTHPANPPVMNATNSDWHHHHEALIRHGVRVEFTYPAEMTRPRRG